MCEIKENRQTIARGTQNCLSAGRWQSDGQITLEIRHIQVAFESTQRSFGSHRDVHKQGIQVVQRLVQNFYRHSITGFADLQT